jgi:hypothetical protein
MKTVVDVERLDEGRYLLTKQGDADNDGLVDWLLACPDKGWFVRLESESTVVDPFDHG